MSIKRDEGLTVWQVERHVQKGAGVTWSYGALSTMDLVLSYGFVPQVCVPMCPYMCPYMCPVCALLELRFCASGLALFVGFVSLYIRSLLTLCLVSFDTIFGLF